MENKKISPESRSNYFFEGDNVFAVMYCIYKIWAKPILLAYANICTTLPIVPQWLTVAKWAGRKMLAFDFIWWITQIPLKTLGSIGDFISLAWLNNKTKDDQQLGLIN
jgi:hypothetical protein